MSETKAFVGSVPKNYDSYMGPVMFEPFAKEMASRVAARPAMRLLETAAGTGRVTSHLANRLPEDGRIVATDLNDDMLEIARSRIADPRVSFEVADAQSISYGSDSFDSVICQFGVMFFPDKLTAQREALRVLKSHRQFMYTVWGSIEQNPNVTVLQQFMSETFPDNPPSFFNTPFGSSNERDNLNLMADAGFIHVRYEPVTIAIEAESAEFLAKGLVCGSPLSAELTERGITDLDAFAVMVGERFAKELGDKPFRSEMTAIFVSGEKP